MAQINFGMLNTDLPAQIGAMPANALAARRKRIQQDEDRAFQREGAQMQNTLARIQMTKAQRDMDVEDATRAALSGGGEWGDVIERVKAVDPVRALDIESKVGNVQSSKASAQAAVTKQAWDKLERYRQHGLQYVQTPQQYAAWLHQQHTDPELAPVMSMLPPLEESLRTIPSDPAQFEQFRLKGMLGLQKWLEMNKPETRQIDTGSETKIVQITPDGRMVTVGAMPKGMSPDARAADARARERLSFDRTNAPMQGKPPAGYRFTPDGNLEAIPGGPADKTAVATEGERKAATLLMRMEGSLGQLQEVTSKDASASKPELLPAAIRAVTFGTGEAAANTITNPNRQRVEAAQLDILDAALTLGTGAAYTREQLEGYRKSYFPQLGDSNATVKDKEARLNNVLQAARIAAGRAASAVPPRDSGTPTQSRNVTVDY